MAAALAGHFKVSIQLNMLKEKRKKKTRHDGWSGRFVNWIGDLNDLTTHPSSDTRCKHHQSFLQLLTNFNNFSFPFFFKKKRRLERIWCWTATSNNGSFFSAKKKKKRLLYIYTQGINKIESASLWTPARSLISPVRREGKRGGGGRITIFLVRSNGRVAATETNPFQTWTLFHSHVPFCCPFLLSLAILLINTHQRKKERKKRKKRVGLRHLHKMRLFFSTTCHATCSFFKISSFEWGGERQRLIRAPIR